MRAPDNDLPADIRLVVGTTGSGKSHTTKEALRSERSAFVFDVKNEYGKIPGFRTVHTRSELVAAAKLRSGRFAWPATSVDDFAFFSSVVWARGECLCIAEELAGVSTSAGQARGDWHKILTQGRGFGIRTIGVTQRPQEIDKTIVAQASLIRCHRLNRKGDRRYMAEELDIDVELVAALQGFEFIERRIVSNELILPPRLRAAGKGHAPDLHRVPLARTKGHALRESRPPAARKGR
ncbi:MAG: hypothetical protein Q8Q73_14760 [Stagnimonas sp.]|nr:hypothetical protein [Stagnimonas sp.]